MHTVLLLHGVRRGDSQGVTLELFPEGFEVRILAH